MSYQQQLNDAAKRCHVGSYAVGANRICAEADATIAAKDAEIASLRDRLRDTAQILIAEVGATGPADAEEVARKAVSQIARLREALEWLLSTVDRQTWSMSRFHAAKDKARAALAQVAEVGK